MSEKPKLRLMLREEGHMWNAYIGGPPEIDKEPVMIGSIAMFAIHEKPERQELFKQLMIGVMTEAIVTVTGKEPLSWHEEAPADGQA